MLNNHTDKIRVLIAQGKTKSALYILQSIKKSPRLDAEDRQQIDLITSRHATLVADTIKGIYTQEAIDIRKNKINHAILDFCDALDAPKNYFPKRIIQLVALGATLCLVVYFIQPYVFQTDTDPLQYSLTPIQRGSPFEQYYRKDLSNDDLPQKLKKDDALTAYYLIQALSMSNILAFAKIMVELGHLEAVVKEDFIGEDTTDQTLHKTWAIIDYTGKILQGLLKAKLSDLPTYELLYPSGINNHIGIALNYIHVLYHTTLLDAPSRDAILAVVASNWAQVAPIYSGHPSSTRLATKGLMLRNFAQR